MFDKCLNAICVGLALVVLVVGCERQQNHVEQDTDRLAIGPNSTELVVPAKIIAKAVDSAGGFSAWTKTKKLELNCVVTIYRPDGSFYLTEHKYDIWPWSKAIRITAQEPLDRFIWEYSEGTFTVAQGDESADVSQMPVSYRDFAELVLRIVTAPAGFCNKTTNLLVQPNPVKFGGLWYQPLELVAQKLPDFSDSPVEAGKPAGRTVHGRAAGEGQKTVEPYWSRIVFFQNQDSSLVEIVWFADVAAQKYEAVRGYDYAEVSNAGVFVPHKIEIFRSDPQLGLRDRLVQIDMK